LPLACRYALASASWISLASSLHPRMFPALVRQGLWSKERALAAALDTRLFRAEALVLLSPLLDGMSRELVFTAALEELRQHGSSLQMRLEAIGHLLPEPVVREVLSWRPILTVNETPVHESASILLPRLAELGHGAEALQRAQQLPASPERDVALCGIAPFMATGEGAALLERLADEFESSDYLVPNAKRAGALARGFAAVGNPVRAREVASWDTWPGTRDFTLEHPTLAFGKMGDADEARRCAELIESPHKRARTLARVSVLFSAEDRAAVLPGALELARETWRGHVEALRIEALAEVGARLDEPLRSQVLEEALEAALSSGDKFERGSTVASIADCLTATLLARAVSELQLIGDHHEAVMTLAAHRQAVAAGARAEVDAECLSLVSVMTLSTDRWINTRALLSEDEPFQSEVLSRASAAAEAIADDDWNGRGVLELPTVAREQWTRIMLEVARRRPATRSHLIPAIAPVVRGTEWHEVFRMARELEVEDSRAGAIEDLAEHADEHGLDEILDLSSRTEDARAAGRLRGAVARQAAKAGRDEEALTLAQQVDSAVQQLQVLADIVRLLPDPSSALPHLIAALKRLRHRPIELSMSPVIQTLPAPLLGPFVEALHDWAARIGETDRSRVFEEMAGPLARAGLVVEAQACARRAGRTQDKISALAAVAAAASSSVRDALAREGWELTTTLPPGLTRATALSTLLPVLDGELRDRAVASIELHALASEIPRRVAEIVTLVLPERTEDVLTIALARQEVLQAFVSATRDAPVQDVQQHWHAATTSAGRMERAETLESLRTIVPWTRRLGGDAALSGAGRSIVRVRRWWP
jgi:hypothetical protein